MADILTHFSCLDELVQVIYQGIHRFVLLSKVDDFSWTVHLGLSGEEGRWWTGKWVDKDILKLAGSSPSVMVLEGFAEKLVETIVKGELSIGDWNEDKGAGIKLLLGPASKRPLHVDLVEIASQEAASYATTMFLDIALQAQSRKCQLNAAPYRSSSMVATSPPPRTTPPSHTTQKPTVSKRSLDTGVASSSKAKTTSLLSDADQKAQDEIKLLKAQLSTAQKRQKSPRDQVNMDLKSINAAKPHKGASLANPNKKARKYQALEFGSDED